jgi:hypothetical protein
LKIYFDDHTLSLEAKRLIDEKRKESKEIELASIKSKIAEAAKEC